MQARPRITTQRRWWDFVQPALDAAGIMASLAFVQWFSGRQVDELTLALGLIAIVAFLLLSQLTGLQRQVDSAGTNHEMSSIAATWTLTFLGLAMLGFVTRYSGEVSRSVVLIWFVLAPTLIGLGRMCLRIIQQGLLRRGIGIRRVAIAGANALGKKTFLNIQDNPSLGLNIAGFYDDRQTERDESSEDDFELTLTGNFKTMIEAARNGEIDTVLITLPMRAEARIRYILDELSNSTVSVYIVGGKG
jgi:putative colanic acid biosysnthesis UDP-glucose lipid carrier transferase